MIKAILLGAGNVACHLSKAFNAANNIEFVQRYRRSDKSDHYFDNSIPVTDNLNELLGADIYVIAINDDHISEFSKKLKFSKGLVVHTSGSIAMQELKCNANKGVMYPLQTFSINTNTDFNLVPLCIETENNKDFTLLNDFATSLSSHVYKVNSLQRSKLHLAAVFANNFSNHMFTLASDLCEENGVPFDVLKPLIFETTLKLKKISPAEAQTGPAKRNDQKVIQSQLDQLQGIPKEIYDIISKSIIATYNKD